MFGITIRILVIFLTIWIALNDNFLAEKAENAEIIMVRRKRRNIYAGACNYLRFLRENKTVSARD